MDGATVDKSSPVGIIVEKTGQTGGNFNFRFSIWNRGTLTEASQQSAVSAESALFLAWPKLAKHSPGWIAGPAATAMLARWAGLALRKRAPGGGRKVAAQGDELVRVTVWMTKTGRTAFTKLAKSKKKKTSLGALIETDLLGLER